MSINKTEMWQRLEGVLGSEATAEMKRIYSLFSPDMIDWFAGLYDPAHGGFYYSNSARDNASVIFKDAEYELLPDAESTCQALGFIKSSGMLYGTEKNYADVLPEWMKKQILDFMVGLQDPDGYFYHPQWGKNIGTSRRARDFNWARSVISALGGSMKYPTILDKPESSSSSETLIPEHLTSLESFEKYVEELNLPERSYVGGNLLSCQAPQIKACGYLDWLISRLDSLQHSETGLWHCEPSYYGVNGLMKISGVYNSAEKPIPNALAAARSAIDAIISDEPVGAVVDLWNTWTAISRITASVLKFGGEEGKRDAERIVEMLRERASEALRRSYDKLILFKKPDGGFSYKPESSSCTSQGMPVAIRGSAEGDVNATVIASALMVNSIFCAFGISEYKIPIFDNDDLPRYLEILENTRKETERNV